jgi:hypothetical protein
VPSTGGRPGDSGRFAMLWKTSLPIISLSG